MRMKFKLPRTVVSAAAAALASAAMLSPASAATIAVFGDNNVDNFLSGLGHTVSLVSDAQLATAGFLNGFDLFVYTRNGASFGTTLSAAAAANVSAFVTGNVVLFASDLADTTGVGDAVSDTLWTNAASWASNKGFIGEFTGACAAMTSNGAGLAALGLISGNCASLGSSSGDPVDVLLNSHPVMAGVPDPFNTPGGTDFYASLSGVAGGSVLALGANNLPTVVAQAAIPQPGGIALLLAGGIAGLVARRRTQA